MNNKIGLSLVYNFFTNQAIEKCPRQLNYPRTFLYKGKLFKIIYNNMLMMK